MSVWEMENIKGFMFDGKYICPACIDDEEMGEVETMQIVTRDELGKKDYAIYCYRCKARL